MPVVWRITTARFAASAFSGEGARRYGGRWNPRGTPLIYTAESRALALLEMLVQDDPLSARYVLIPAHIPDDLPLDRLDADALPADWRTLGARDALQTLGRRWLDAPHRAALIVPSAVVPAEHNVLIDPTHPDFTRIATGPVEALETDMRLLRNLAAQPRGA